MSHPIDLSMVPEKIPVLPCPAEIIIFLPEYAPALLDQRQ
jgi:hypothetical protein